MTATAEPTDVRPTSQWPYYFEVCGLDDLSVDPDYQRPLTTFVDEVAKEWNPALVGTLTVSHREDGTRVIVDGQTRWEAAKRLDDPPNGIPCLIFHGLTKPEEAKLFSDLGRKRRQIRTYERFRADLAAKDTDALTIFSIAANYGLDLSKAKGWKATPPITAIELAYKHQALEKVLATITNAWDIEAPGALGNWLIRGLTHFFRHTEGDIDHDRLDDRLQRVTPFDLRRRASHLAEGRGSGTSGGSAQYMSEAITAEYMKRR